MCIIQFVDFQISTMYSQHGAWNYFAGILSRKLVIVEYQLLSEILCVYYGNGQDERNKNKLNFCLSMLQNSSMTTSCSPMSNGCTCIYWETTLLAWVTYIYIAITDTYVHRKNLFSTLIIMETFTDMGSHFFQDKTTFISPTAANNITCTKEGDVSP